MPIDFYYLPPSPPCRAVQMTAVAVGAELNLKPMKLSDGDHLTPEYLEVCMYCKIQYYLYVENNFKTLRHCYFCKLNYRVR